jgi:hypothetical protein
MQRPRGSEPLRHAPPAGLCPAKQALGVYKPLPRGGGGGAEALRIELGHASIPDPGLGYDTPFPGTLLWAVWSSLGGVRTLSNGFRLLYFGGPGRAHRGPVSSGPNGVVSENATLTAHKIPLRLFSARLRVTAHALCLYTVVRGTLNPGYRHIPCTISDDSRA